MLRYRKKIRSHLTKMLPKANGRNNQGRITVRHRGGGIRKRYNLVDFFRVFFFLQAIVIEPLLYDSRRSSFISLILYKNGFFSYILKPRFLQKNDKIIYSKDYKLQLGCAFPLRTIPEGIFLNSVEFKPGKGAQLARSAGTFVFIINKFFTLANKILIKCPSSEEYLLDCNNLAVIGRLDNLNHINRKLTKAGQNRNKGIRPHVRGVAMNPIDHPHGGNTSIGRQPVSPWGKYAKGGKTKKTLNKYIYTRKSK